MEPIDQFILATVGRPLLCKLTYTAKYYALGIDGRTADPGQTTQQEALARLRARDQTAWDQDRHAVERQAMLDRIAETAGPGGRAGNFHPVQRELRCTFGTLSHAKATGILLLRWGIKPNFD